MLECFLSATMRITHNSAERKGGRGGTDRAVSFTRPLGQTTGPIKLKFHMETPWDAGTKVCSNGPGHMNKMAATPIYGKNPLKILSRTRRPMTLGPGM